MFSKKIKGPQDSAKTLKENLTLISKLDNQTDKKYIKLSDDISAILINIKSMLYGGQDGEPQSDVTAQVAQEIYQSDVLMLLIENLPRIEFEARKDSGAILGNLLRRKIGTHFPTVDYICNNKQILSMLMAGYTNPEVALNCGTMLRDCIRHDRLAIIVLNFDNFYKFFDYVEMSAFDIASDAFSTFKELLTRHKMVAADFLEANYIPFFKNYDRLLSSGSYVTRRQALKLLGELLLDRHNFTIMTKYISSPENLKLMMNMLKEKSKNIQFEAFHVFKVFVANPNKPPPIQEILFRNQEKLIDYLSKFHNDRTDDEQFIDEKTYLVKQIKEMKPPE